MQPLPQNESNKFQKLYFPFSYCKLLQLAGCFAPISYLTSTLLFLLGSADKDEFLREAQLMKKLRHPRLVQLYAVCSRSDPIYIVTELMCNGALNTYLQGKDKETVILDATCEFFLFKRNKEDIALYAGSVSRCQKN